jgi:hypothetical protein
MVIGNELCPSNISQRIGTVVEPIEEAKTPSLAYSGLQKPEVPGLQSKLLAHSRSTDFENFSSWKEML